MQARLLKLALAASTILASFGAFASPYDGCTTIAKGIIHCWGPSQVSRDEVKDELKQAEKADELKVVGELSGAPAAVLPQPVTTLTRAQVREELRQAQREGQVEFGELGRTDAEINPQRYAGAKPSQGRGAVANSR